MKAYDHDNNELKVDDKVEVVAETTSSKRHNFNIRDVYTISDIRDRIGVVVFFKERDDYGLDGHLLKKINV